MSIERSWLVHVAEGGKPLPNCLGMLLLCISVFEIYINQWPTFTHPWIEDTFQLLIFFRFSVFSLPSESVLAQVQHLSQDLLPLTHDVLQEPIYFLHLLCSTDCVSVESKWDSGPSFATRFLTTYLGAKTGLSAPFFSNVPLAGLCSSGHLPGRRVFAMFFLPTRQVPSLQFLLQLSLTSRDISDTQELPSDFMGPGSHLGGGAQQAPHASGRGAQWSCPSLLIGCRGCLSCGPTPHCWLAEKVVCHAVLPLTAD